MSIDQCMHSLFGASKVAADVLVQEYGRYFGMHTACFRGGCLTGPGHSGTQLHGFLSYLMKCAMTGAPYTVFGYKGKQVRDNIHSNDLVQAFDAFLQSPRTAPSTILAEVDTATVLGLKRLAIASRSVGKSSCGPMPMKIAPVTTSGGSATLAVSRKTFPAGV